MESLDQTTNPQQNKSRWFARGGVLTGLMSVIGASCCILPIFLVNIGLSSALVSHLGVFARLRPWFIALSAAFIVVGLIYAFRAGRRPSKRTLIVLIVATLLTVSALVLPYYEGDIQRWLSLTSR